MVVFEGIMTWLHHFQLLLMENKSQKMFAFLHTLPAPQSEVCLWGSCNARAPFINVEDLQRESFPDQQQGSVVLYL